MMIMMMMKVLCNYGFFLICDVLVRYPLCSKFSIVASS